MANLEMTRGDDLTAVFTFDGDSTFGPLDVVWFTVKHRHTDPDAAAVVQLVSTAGQITLDGPTATAQIPGVATSNLDRATRLVYDWQLYSGAEKVRTLDSGTITVVPDVTRATAP